jgi:hypothetical protein
VLDERGYDGEFPAGGFAALGGGEGAGVALVVGMSVFFSFCVGCRGHTPLTIQPISTSRVPRSRSLKVSVWRLNSDDSGG